MIHLYTGDGKGKTTAAAGLAVRAAGSGLRVLFSQFMKGNDTGELHALSKLPGVTIVRSDRQFGFYSALSDRDKEELTCIHNRILDRILAAAGASECDMIILDEITYPVNWRLLSVGKVKQLLFAAGKGSDGFPEVVMTGREPADFILDSADYITEMRMIRHPFEKGIPARRGIEY